ncbi:MAG TPA: ribosomal protein S18-alanine N-acetyltransferase [Anaerolinea sp.]|nr:ribosomal protein S18-alanine N-acetyltransferase [Anaerolinea sp.]
MSEPVPGAEVRLRPMRLEDVPRVHQLDVMSFSLPWPERSYRFEVGENRASSCWVAEAARPGEPATVVGMMVNWVIVDELHIATIAVHPDYRRAGIGRRLLVRGLRAGWERGARKAFLEVRRGNLAAQAMYFRFGFTVNGERKQYYQDNHEDALLMVLEPLEPERLLGLDARERPEASN